MAQRPIQTQLHALRKAQGLTQPQMAARMGVEERTYRSWEQGKTSPTVDRLELLAESFGRNLQDLLQVCPDTGMFPSAEAPSPTGKLEHLAATLLNDPDLPTKAKERILRIWRAILGGRQGDEGI